MHFYSKPLSLLSTKHFIKYTKRGNKTYIDKLFRTRNEYPEDELKYEKLPTRELEPEDRYHKNAFEKIQMEEDGNDERNIGPYPRLPNTPYSYRSPYDKWDYPQWRRNFNEPVRLTAVFYYVGSL